MMNNPIVFITGATAGFGEACAEKFAANGYDVIITGRRKERLDELQQRLGKQFSVKALALEFDVRDFYACRKAINSLPEEWKNISVLINNAGLAMGLSPIDEGDVSDWNTMIDTNIKGLLYVSRLIIPFLKKSGRPHIINIGSTAAKDVYPNGNVYCATKHAVDAISQAMRIDLLQFGIKVTAVHPGAAETEFSVVRFKGDEEKAKNVYEGYTPLHAGDIAEAVYFCVTRPAHVCINDLVITPTAQANALHWYKGE